MEVELQEAPAVEVIEDGIEEIPDMVAHIYTPGRMTSFCGVHINNDPHHHFHVAQGLRAALVPPGCTTCKACGAAICESCFALNTDERGTE